MVLGEMLEISAEKYPEKKALVSQETFLTYRELYEKVLKMANALSDLGIKKGEAIGLFLPNTFQFVIAYYAIARLGGIVVPMNIMFKTPEVVFVLENAKVRACITSEAFLSIARAAQKQVMSLEYLIVRGKGDNCLSWDELIEKGKAVAIGQDVKDEDTLIYLYTSGTTGKPKGAILSHYNLYANALAMAERSLAYEKDTYLCVLPLFHTFAATCCMNTPLSQGGTIILMENFIPQALVKNIARHRVTIFTGVPSMYTVLVNLSLKEFDLTSLRLCISGGSSLPVEIIQKAEQKLGVMVLEGYGLSEASPVVTFNQLHQMKVGSIGTSLTGVETKIFDENDRECPLGTIGEIVTKGPNVMKGYLGLPEESALTLRNGWLHTGDLGKMDEDGYVFLVDRKKDLVIVAGLNVYPREVEEVLYTHPAVLEAAVTGIPDLLRGEVLKAVVVLKKERSASAKEIIHYCRQNLAAYKVPRKIEFREFLPKSATGKILKRELT